MTRRALLVAAALLAAVLMLLVTWVDLLRGSPPASVVTLPLPITGLLILSRRPGQAIGWCLYALGIAAASAGLSDGLLRLTDADGMTILRTAAAGINHVAFATMLVSLGFLLLLFPTGRPRSPRWRWATRLVATSFLLLVLSGWFSPEPISPSEYGPGVVSPGALESETVSSIVGGVGFSAIFISYGLGIMSLVLRWVRARDDERAQLKWFALTAGGGTVLVFVGPLLFSGPAGERFFEFLILPFFAVGVPVSIALAVLKYRLYDIDVIINRTLVYALLTAVLVTAYAVGVLILRTILDPLTGDNDIAIAASTLAVAALFGPARGRIQRFIDRRFYRSRYDAQQTLEHFAARLRDEVDLDLVVADLRAVVEHTLQPQHVAVWIR